MVFNILSVLENLEIFKKKIVSCPGIIREVRLDLNAIWGIQISSNVTRFYPRIEYILILSD